MRSDLRGLPPEMALVPILGNPHDKPAGGPPQSPLSRRSWCLSMQHRCRETATSCWTWRTQCGTSGRAENAEEILRQPSRSGQARLANQVIQASTGPLLDEHAGYSAIRVVIGFLDVVPGESTLLLSLVAATLLSNATCH